MLTAKENMLEVIKGGNPDRVVNQYEALYLMMNPYEINSGKLISKGTMNAVDAWGVTQSFPTNTPGSFPVHTADKVVIKDFEHWQDYVHAPSTDWPEEEWAFWKEQYDALDSSKAWIASFVHPGLFEQCHHLGEIQKTLMAFYECPDEMHDLIKYLTDFELSVAEKICKYLKPEAIFHHDDFGSQNSTFMAPSMWEEFFVEPYKQIYGYYHEHGVDLVFHHSDSYGATLLPSLIEMGIDVWQGCFSTNNIPDLIKKYGGQISFMGGIENRLVDFDGWTHENSEKIIRETIEACGNKYFIPCIAQGGPGSVFPGVYADMCQIIDDYNKEKFGFTQEQLDEQRLPWQILF